MGGFQVIVSKTDYIPTKKIVEVLGEIKVKDYKDLGEGESMQRLIRKAKTIGADAIINFSCRRGEILWYDLIDIYTGLAVITEDVIPIKQVLNTNVCWNCGISIEKDQRYCRNCFAKLI